MDKNKDKLYNELISKYEFNEAQKMEILYGLTKGLDVTWYAKPEFDYLQMKQILSGLKTKIEVSVYAKPEFNS